jgi:hypothetical protein
MQYAHEQLFIASSADQIHHEGFFLCLHVGLPILFSYQAAVIGWRSIPTSTTFSVTFLVQHVSFLAPRREDCPSYQPPHNPSRKQALNTRTTPPRFRQVMQHATASPSRKDHHRLDMEPTMTFK